MPSNTASTGARLSHELQGVKSFVARKVYRVAAPVWRRCLTNTTFVAVTGSTGKTTTKIFIGAMLRSRLRGSYTVGTLNTWPYILRNVWKGRRDDRFHVLELSAGQGPGSLAEPLALIRPGIAVVTNVAHDHYSAFGSIDAIAQEKAAVIRALPADGTAIVNADDPRVMAMVDQFPGRVISFGRDRTATVRAEDVRAAWPDRLSFTLVLSGRRLPIATRLYGAQSLPSVLAGFAVAHAFGLMPEEVAAAVDQVEPFHGRMSVVRQADGVTWIRDDWKATVTTFPAAFAFMRDAEATRKVVVIGTIADTSGDAGTTYTRVARLALEVAEQVVFVGAHSFSALRAQPTDAPGRLRSFATVKAATEYLQSALRPGDLVLLKGSNPADHLYRVALARDRAVTCWIDHCGRQAFCDQCARLAAPPASPGGDGRRPGMPAAMDAGLIATVAEADAVIVGLGNPGERYRDTPHNAGYRALDFLAQRGGAAWDDHPTGQVATVALLAERVALVKLQVPMNLTGKVLRDLLAEAGHGHQDCILVFDDADLPLGTLRGRLRGSDGGHRGVRSVLEALQTDQVPRLKIGIRAEAEHRKAGDTVLAPFGPGELAREEIALREVASRLQSLRHEVGVLAAAITPKRRAMPTAPPVPDPALPSRNAAKAP